jgi:hypothetical protein
VAILPNQINVFDAAPGAQWTTTYTLTNNDGTLMNIVGKTFEFVIRHSPTEASTVTPAVMVNSTSSTASGTIIVNTAASTVQVILTPVATAVLVQVTPWVYALWMDPGLSDAVPLVEGSFVTSPVAAP